MNTITTGRRFDFEDRRFTPAEHRAEWDQRIRVAMDTLQETITTAPPWTYTVQVEIPKDDPRYKDAPISEVWMHIEGPKGLAKKL